MVFKKDLIKLKKKYKIHTIRKDIKNLKYVKTIKMYKILIHLNYKCRSQAEKYAALKTFAAVLLN